MSLLNELAVKLVPIYNENNGDEMKTLTTKEAAQAVLDGKTVLAKWRSDNWLVSTSTKDHGLFDFRPFPEIENDHRSYKSFFFKDDYTYTIYEEPKQEEKKYRWLIENQGYEFQTNHYATYREVKESHQKTCKFKKLDCLDDLKDKPYYREEF